MTKDLPSSAAPARFIGVLAKFTPAARNLSSKALPVSEVKNSVSFCTLISPMSGTARIFWGSVQAVSCKASMDGNACMSETAAARPMPEIPSPVRRRSGVFALLASMAARRLSTLFSRPISPDEMSSSRCKCNEYISAISCR